MLNSNLVTLVLLILCSFALGLFLCHVLIPVLRRMKAGQEIREEVTQHKSKAGTPTMGGLSFIGVSLLCLVFGIRYMRQGDFSALFVLVLALAFGVIGFLDDFFKVKLHRNLGLTAIQKALLQMAVSLLFLYVLYRNGLMTCDLYIPFMNVSLTVNPVVYMVFAVFVMVGCVNAVNLTDGLDGLSSGVTIPVMVFFTIAAFMMKRYNLALLPAALVGGLCAFLRYNFYPAKVFMGDTGSMFLGGVVCGMAFALDMPLILILVGLIYLVETLSVILQVGYFKLTHGKRIFKMTPIHHHFEKCGWSEKKVFAVFVSVTVVMCVLAWLGIQGRF